MLDIKLIAEHEILGMSGPWIAHLMINNRNIAGKFLYQPLIYDVTKERLALAEMISSEGGWRINTRFAITVINFVNQSSIRSVDSFLSLYVNEISDNRIVYFNAFHNHENQFREELTISSSSFIHQTELAQQIFSNR